MLLVKKGTGVMHPCHVPSSVVIQKCHVTKIIHHSCYLTIIHYKAQNVSPMCINRHHIPEMNSIFHHLCHLTSSTHSLCRVSTNVCGIVPFQSSLSHFIGSSWLVKLKDLLYTTSCQEEVLGV